MKSEALDIRFLVEVNRSLAGVYAGLLLGGVALGTAAAWATCWRAGGFVWSAVVAGFAGTVLGLAALRGTFVRRAIGSRARTLGRWCAVEGLCVAEVAKAAADADLGFVSDLTVRYRWEIDAALDRGSGSNESGSR